MTTQPPIIATETQPTKGDRAISIAFAVIYGLSVFTWTIWYPLRKKYEICRLVLNYGGPAHVGSTAVLLAGRAGA